MRVWFGRVVAGITLGRLFVVLVCLALLGWVWWDSQVDGYAGLPVNTLGQIVGDLLLAAIAGPVALGFRFARHARARPIGDLPDRLTRARHRIQLLDTTGCLLSWSVIALSNASRSDAESERGRLIAALRAALERDVAVEVLIPEPDLAPSRSALRAFGLSAAAYRELAEATEADLLALHDAVRAGRLDVRTSRERPPLAVVRCDGRVWASLPSDGMSELSPLYLEFGARTGNARALAAHFNELHRRFKPSD